jgi:hypothetical protein
LEHLDLQYKHQAIQIGRSAKKESLPGVRTALFFRFSPHLSLCTHLEHLVVEGRIFSRSTSIGF